MILTGPPTWAQVSMPTLLSFHEGPYEGGAHQRPAEELPEVELEDLDEKSLGLDFAKAHLLSLRVCCLTSH